MMREGGGEKCEERKESGGMGCMCVRVIGREMGDEGGGSNGWAGGRWVKEESVECIR